MNRQTMRNVIAYLKILEEMERTNPDWYLNEFRAHKDWKIGLTSTISKLEEWLLRPFPKVQVEEDDSNPEW